MTTLREHRIFGPPGTGKTTTMTRNLANAASKYGASNVFCASFTKAASAELASRAKGFPKSQIGTLHSHGYHAIGTPDPIKPDTLKLWNERHSSLALPLDLYSRDREQQYEDGFDDADSPKALHDAYQAGRNTLTPIDQLPEGVQAFGARWESWKRDLGVIDFTDMIELAYLNAPTAPGAPAIGFFDEVQDFTPLELALVRKWGAAMEQIVLAGDDDQMIYGFKGASVDAFLDESIEPASVTVLKQSFRIPSSVHRAASGWISGVRRRQAKPYLPRDEEGVARVLWDTTIDDVEPLLALIEDRLARSPEYTVMVLVDAARMLETVLHGLRSAGVPFHNPYSERHGDWSPLRPTRGVSAGQRVVALSRYDDEVWGEAAALWTPEDVARWIEPLKATGVLVHGAKKRAAALPPDYEIDDLAACFVDGKKPGAALDRLATFDLDWYGAHLTGQFASKGGMQFALTVARKRGVPALTAPPRVIVGTIHSVKGGEADTVILCPDLSYFRQQDVEAGGDLADDVRRLFYVGMTRARHELLITAPSSRRSIHPHDLLGVA